MDKVVLITGSNKGIGFEIARQLGKIGFYVIISGRDESRLKTAIEKLQQEKIITDALLMDVSSHESIESAAGNFRKKNLEIDVLINNAAILDKGDHKLLNNHAKVLYQTINTNSYGPLLVTNAFLPFIKPNGRILMISSGGGSVSEGAQGWSPAYCVSKTLLNAITRQLAYELKNKNISVNAVCPGWVRTDMGGTGANRSLEKGAETPVWLATESPQKFTGLFFRDKKVIQW